MNITLVPQELLLKQVNPLIYLFRYLPIRVKCIVFLCVVFCTSCSDGKEVLMHNPAGIIVIDSITPDVAGMAEDMFIYGQNFSTNKEEIKVSINGKNAAVVGARMNCIYVVVPKRPDANGNVIVTIGDKSSNEFPFTYKTAEVAQTLAGTGVSGDVDGTGEKAQFNFSDMSGLCLNPANEVVIADCGNGKIKSISVSGEVKTIASGLQKPMDVIYDKDGNLFLANCDGMTIVKIGADKKQKVVGRMDWPTAVAYDETTDKVVGVLYSGTNIMAVKDKNVEATDSNPNMEVFMPTNGINISFMRFKDGDLYFTSSNKHAVYVLRKGTDIPEVIAGIPGKKGITTVETNAKEALLTNPCGLDFAPNGDIYFSSGTTTRGASEDNKLYMLRQKDGKVLPFIGKKEAGNADGGSSNAMFDSPAAIRIDKDNSVYLIDKRNYKVRKITVQ